MINKKWLLISFLSVLTIFLFVNSQIAESFGGESTEVKHNKQIEIDDEIMSKDYNSLTKEEKKRLEKIQKLQEPKQSLYQKRAAKHLANDQPHTWADYEKKSAEYKNSELQDFNPKFKRDPRLSKAPEPEFQVVRYNYPAGSREINLVPLKTVRNAKSQGVISPDGKMVVYSDVNYDTGMKKTSSSVYVINVNANETRAQRRVNYIHGRENRLKEIEEELEKNPNLKKHEIDFKKAEIKQLQKDIKQLKLAHEQQSEEENNAVQNNSQAALMARALVQAHIKDQQKTPILSSGVYDMDYGISRTLTVIDWSNNSKRVLMKEKIGQDGSGIWQTNIWVYDFETGEAKKLDEIRQAIDYYWKKDRMVDLYNYRFDLYPLGWDAQHSDRVLTYVYGYTKDPGVPPKFLGTWSIDYKGEQSHLVSVTKTGYIVQANGFCLQGKNLEFYEREKY